MNPEFWRGRRVFLTGHTGFKGGWLALWLHTLGAKVSGYALQPPTHPSLFVLCHLQELLEESTIADVRDAGSLQAAMRRAQPEILFHLAAQPLVRASYQQPVETYATNVMGTVHLLEAARHCPSLRAILNVTSDKCYENREWHWGYRENEPLGGYDPYSSSKACAELVTTAYRNAFFHPDLYPQHGVALASARAGNVIGGGDWATDRLIPDCIRALLANQPIIIRNPHAIRPWQHVLEPLSGYLLLAQRLVEEGTAFGEGWNFGPKDEDAQSVEHIVHRLCALWGGGAHYQQDGQPHPHEASHLKLECSKAQARLGWRPRWTLEQAIASIITWYQSYQAGLSMRNVCLQQIHTYSGTDQ
ncbi:MAG: CDP-glucose 4,6-dehydratase [Magnetococcus sp. YQC-3]